MAETDNKNITISFLGDVSLNDAFIDRYQREEKPFQGIGSVLKESDFVVGNLECMVKGKAGENELKYPRLTTTSETLNYLNDIHLSVVTLAHNHVYDHLLDGYQKTCAQLESFGIRQIGSGMTSEEAAKPLILEQNGIKIGLLNYVTEDTNPNLPDGCAIFLNFFDEQKATMDIGKLKEKTDHVVVLLHWGGHVENGYYPDKNQPETARSLIESGADLIIGHHSHTFQPFEEYRKRMIFYSLGNFCFADILCDEKVRELWQGRHTESAIVDATFTKSSIRVVVRPLMIESGRPVLKQELLRKFEKRNKIFQRMLRHKWIWFFYRVKLKKIDPLIYFFGGTSNSPLSQLRKLNVDKVLRYSGLRSR